MANNWQHLNFFDKNGKYYNFDYDTSADKWTGTIYLPEVSIGLFEVGQICSYYKNLLIKILNTKEFGFPFGLEVSTGDHWVYWSH